MVRLVSAAYLITWFILCDRFLHAVVNPRQSVFILDFISAGVY